MNEPSDTACALPRSQGKGRSLAALVLLCAHCSLTALGGVAAILLAAAGIGWSATLSWVLPPILIVSLLLFLMFGGRYLEWRGQTAQARQSK